MKQILKYLSLGAMLAASSTAFANPLVGTLTIDGGSSAINPPVLNASTTSITFAPIDELTFYGTGAFSSAGLAFVPFTTPFTFTVGPVFSGELLFTIVDSFGSDAFTVDQVLTAPNGSLTFYGTLADGSKGNYILTPDQSQNGSFSGTLTTSTGYNGDGVPTTPEPSGLILLGTGLAGMAGFMSLRKRRSVPARLIASA
jgi:hypothetical protein